MNQEAYVKKIYEKFNRMMARCEQRMFKHVANVENVYAMETMEHLRKPPMLSEMKPIEPGTRWGKEWASMWVKAEITVPPEADGRVLCLLDDTGSTETMCFKNGKPSGIINSKHKFLGGWHSMMYLSTDASVGDKYVVDLECYCNHNMLGCGPFETYGNDDYVHDFSRVFNKLELVVIDEVVYECLFDLHCVLQIAQLKNSNNASLKAHECLMKAFPYLLQDFDLASDEEFHESISKVKEALAPALEKGTGDRSRGYVGVLGHSHMDTAWLWPVDETIRKCARTYSQALTLMDIYPAYTFIQSSALHLDWMREYYPDIFDGIKKRVAEGRYEPNGGVWVECDCNVTGGESMVRQFLYGQRFTQKHLNYLSDSFWLPDTFGYNAAIPQIMQGCGVKYFYTTKISWNDLNTFPTDTFIWRGIDGSEVLTHFTQIVIPPDPKNMDEAVSTRIADKYSTDMKLSTYGFGDGGGGPTFGQLEFLKRTTEMDGLPVVEPTTASAFMQKLEERRDKLPLFDGELYLEGHRGTLTTIHEVKKNNRLAENAMHDMELFNVLSGEATNEKRDDLYKIMLMNQFHDILPGTCIPPVYDRTIPEMAKMIADTEAETGKYAAKMANGDEKKTSLFNTLSFDRDDIAVFDGERTFEGKVAQTYTDYNGDKKTAVRVAIPAMEAAVLIAGDGISAESPFKAEGNKLTTPYYEVEFDSAGYISSLIDIEADRQIKREGGASLGTLWMGEDVPDFWDNWDIESDVFMVQKPVTGLISREVVSDGALEYRIRSEYKLGRKSSAVIDTVFYADSRRIDYNVKVDWQDKHQLLKAGFDLNIRSATVKNEIQFGHIDRPTTRNNSWEDAKFEICNHKWSDLSETHYGVALLNNCKYGLSAKGSELRLSLHKGGCRPDPYHEIGVHETTYSLLPHIGAFNAETVIQDAYELNFKPVQVKGEMSTPKLFSISNPGIICETVKCAEDVEGAYVLRLYESERNNTSCKLNLFGAKRAWITDMLENKLEEIALEGGVAKLRFRPFEIKTILVER
ncbi:MAG: alpha-mannosidase [Ruminococcaceae bacterium]|nr:alpha-mannosidase [Oscillospiraceae bacterium]